MNDMCVVKVQSPVEQHSGGTLSALYQCRSYYLKSKCRSIMAVKIFTVPDGIHAYTKM